MIVYEGKGDLFSSSQRTRVCPINVVGAMGKGLALSFRQRYKGLFQAYLEGLYQYGKLPMQEHLKANRLFQMRWQAEWEPDHDVLLLPTKLHWKDKSSAEFIEEHLALLVKNHVWLGVTDLALPLIGCGEGGLSYRHDIRPLLHRYLGGSYPHAVGIYFG